MTDVDDVLGQAGGSGRFQLLIFVLLSLVYLRGSWHVFGPIYLGYDPGHHCTPYPNFTLNESVPGTIDNGVIVYESCDMYSDPGLSNKTVPCKYGWTYTWESPGESSFVAEWNLVCDRDFQAELSTTIYMVGTACGALFLTPLSDRFGRKLVMLACLWIQAALGFAVAWVHNYTVFTVLRFFIGLTNMTISLAAYVLMTEMFTASRRTLPSIGINFFWGFGIMVFALFGYLVRDWRHLQMLISLPNLLTVFYTCLIPESVHWLVSREKLENAEKALRYIARINKKKLPSDVKNQLKTAAENLDQSIPSAPQQQNGGYQSKEELVTPDNQPQDSQCGETVLTLLCTPKMRVYCFIMFYLFLVNSLSYFGISFSTPSLNGNRFLNLFISGAVEVPAYIIASISNRLIGRRLPICVFLLVCSVMNIAAFFLPETTDDGKDLSALKITLVMVGKFAITGSYSAIYLYASEIFPTPVRNHAVGVSSFFENVGSISAPLIVYGAKKLAYLPLVTFGIMTVIGGILVLFLPETHNRPLPQTIEDIINWGKQTKGHVKEEITSISGKRQKQMNPPSYNQDPYSTRL